MKSSEVATAIGLPISTIRYYEKMGIIPDEYIIRDQNNYRNYTPQIIQHLDVVKKCLAVGFSINEIKLMILGDGMSKEEQTRIINAKISEIEDAQQSLEESKQNLHDILESGITCESGFGKY